jgi:CO/xanthine dehydrogenase FAD-binding subunit
MSSLQWIDAKSVEEAVSLLSTDERDTTIAKAGGMDLLDLIKEGIIAPARIVNLQRIDALRGVQVDDAIGLRLGSLTTLAEIASHAAIRQRYPALAAAAAHAATPQVRNAATIGGNLLQRPRCWYFRNEVFTSHATKSVASNPSMARSSTTRTPRWCTHQRRRQHCWRTAPAFTSSANQESRARSQSVTSCCHPISIAIATRHSAETK